MSKVGPVWERLKARHVIRKPERIRQAASADPAAVFAFDLLWLNGADFRPISAPNASDSVGLYLRSNMASKKKRTTLRRKTAKKVIATVHKNPTRNAASKRIPTEQLSKKRPALSNGAAESRRRMTWRDVIDVALAAPLPATMLGKLSRKK
jgi:hypothetical protein